MKILFISEPYIERLLFDYFAENSSHQFIFLKANHPQMNDNEFSNLFFYSFDEALNKCDYIYILSSGCLPISMLKKCNAYAESTGKHLICDSVDREENSISDNAYIENVLLTISSEKPNILILQVGKKTQIERVELNLCSRLNENGIKYALYSNTWSDKIKTISKSLNLSCPYGEVNIANQINVITLKSNIVDLFNSNLYFDRFMFSVKPDFIVMSCENGYDLQQKLDEIFKLKYSREIDVFIESEYVSLRLNGEKEITLFIEKTPSKNIFDDIKNKLTFPHGIKELSFRV